MVDKGLRVEVKESALTKVFNCHESTEYKTLQAAPKPPKMQFAFLAS